MLPSEAFHAPILQIAFFSDDFLKILFSGAGEPGTSCTTNDNSCFVLKFNYAASFLWHRAWKYKCMFRRIQNDHEMLFNIAARRKWQFLRWKETCSHNTHNNPRIKRIPPLQTLTNSEDNFLPEFKMITKSCPTLWPAKNDNRQQSGIRKCFTLILFGRVGTGTHVVQQAHFAERPTGTQRRQWKFFFRTPPPFILFCVEIVRKIALQCRVCYINESLRKTTQPRCDLLSR